MSKHFFTDEEVRELSKNPNVERVSNKGITYKQSIKDHFVESDEEGKSAKEISIRSGFDLEILGLIRPTPLLSPSKNNTESPRHKPKRKMSG